MPETPRQSVSILIVDDEPEIRSILSDLLCKEYDCTLAASAEEALDALAENPFDLVLSDIDLRGISGLQLVPLVRVCAPDCVVIMISGMQTMESAIEALRVGAFDYIMKPFDLRQVEAAVRRALNHRSLLISKRLYENYLESLVKQRTNELEDALGSLEEAYRSTLKALTTALETRDHETHGHSERVVIFSLRLGREMGLSKEEMNALEFGSLLHDIGKIGVPDAILRKPASLTDQEWTRMKEHPLHGQQILNGIEFLEGAARVVAQHHEKYDGSGYPLGLKGEEIDLNARIFAVADAFDAMRSDRVYRKGRSYEEALEELERCAGAHFDPTVVDAFQRIRPDEWEQLCRRPILSAQEKIVTGNSHEVVAQQVTPSALSYQ
ncbi:MAG: HD domain-containing phosphohydrolase [Pyrinomonadaceae bacterium]